MIASARRGSREIPRDVSVSPLVEINMAHQEGTDQRRRPSPQFSVTAMRMSQDAAASKAAKQAQCKASTIQTTGSNGDETRYPNRIGNYHKGLPHDGFGEVDLAAYSTLLN